MREYKYIALCIANNTHLYQVRIPEIKNGELVPRSKKYTSFCFSKNHYHSIEACLRAAVKKRNSYLRSINAYYLVAKDARYRRQLKKNYCNRPDHFEVSTRNTSGVIGVVVSWTYRKSGCYYSYRAIWQEKTKKGPKGRSKSFSPDIYGECEAFKMACRVRAEMRPPLIITDLDAVPCLPDVEYKPQDTTYE